MHSEQAGLLHGPGGVHQGGHAAGMDQREGAGSERQQGMS